MTEITFIARNVFKSIFLIDLAQMCVVVLASAAVCSSPRLQSHDSAPRNEQFLFDTRKEKKKITTYRSQSRGSFAPARPRTRYSLLRLLLHATVSSVLPSFFDLFHADEINSAWRYLSFGVECSSRTTRLIRADKSHGARPERRGDLSRLNVFISIYLPFASKSR